MGSLSKLTDVSQLGGAVTTGGVMSNTYALMAAARKYPDKKIVIANFPGFYNSMSKKPTITAFFEV
ncbi:hypothetical protein [Lactobacillus delbrueckii]|uniref:hypothetical protein n=1 Tax=Lactobacillus delbrueckii TaxID=1584 RepID=UPI001E49EA2E|nr:hypothetical protein [Lactobacillus delbrueckii]